jgi:ribonuclease HII
MNLRYEKKKLSEGHSNVIGCDEVGRGCLAGPVVAAAVVLDLNHGMKGLKEVRDSKLLTAEKREELSKIIKKIAIAWSIGSVSQNIVDKINIHNASLLAMKKAILNLTFSNSRELENNVLLAVDGKFAVPKLVIRQEAIVDGDNKILSIAAASIIAKVYRDRLMKKLHETYPVYNFAQHKGYATEYHRQMILEHGLSPLHRLSFCENLAV